MQKEQSDTKPHVQMPDKAINRYFFFAALYSLDDRQVTRNYGIARTFFPTNEYLKNIVKNESRRKGAEDIVIISLCEMTPSEFEAFWKAE